MRIGQVAEETGVSARMLRYYEKQGLIDPGVRTSAGYREYDAEDIETIFHIEGLRGLGLSMAEVKNALDDPKFSFTDVLDELLVESRRRLREEKRLYDQLRAVKKSQVRDWPAALEVMNLLHNLRSQVPSLRQDSVMRLEPTADPRHVARLALDEDNANVAGALSWSVLRAGPTALAEVVAALQHDNPEVRLRAVRIIERAKGTDEHLLGALDDPEASVRGAAALALGERGGQQAFEELMRMIVDGDHDTAAADTVAQASSWQDKALSTISALLNDDHVLPAQRARLVQALAEFAGSYDVLRELVADPTPAVALTATAILNARASAR